MEGTIGLLLFLGIVCFLFYRLYILPLVRQNGLKNQYQSMAEPRLMLQSGETDTEFWARVSREKQRFLESGNQWALKQVPVVAIPFDAHFTIVWFDKARSFSTVGMRQREYNRQAMQIYDMLWAEWQQQVFGKFGDSVAFEAMGQEPFDPKNIWQDLRQNR
jgi:hypothetical protein